MIDSPSRPSVPWWRTLIARFIGDPWDWTGVLFGPPLYLTFLIGFGGMVGYGIAGWIGASIGCGLILIGLVAVCATIVWRTLNTSGETDEADRHPGQDTQHP